VPHPRWVKVDEVEIPQRYINDGAEALRSQLGREGIEKIGGKTWWEWRRAGSDLKAEWIEMRSDYWNRKEKRLDSDRVILYIHGGAYFFGSVDEHRYQMQRHARKLKGRVFAPRYRLAPQFPFPCGLHDCLSAYLYLISVQHPSTILLAGDSAGGGMVLRYAERPTSGRPELTFTSILVLLRDRGLPLPAGAILISPWVDLTHSLPSVGGDNPLDYIPPHGFQQRPSVSWPPPNADELNEVARKQGRRSDQELAATRATEHESVQGYTVSATPTAASRYDILLDIYSQ
jgi:acetyl esterase/lipase